ncbi:MAG: hypothetical protein ACYCOY_06770 [Metallibacterium sp.]
MSYLRIVQQNRAAQGAGSASAHCLIAQLQEHRGASITGQYRLTGATDVPSGTPHLKLTLADATGSVLGFVWPEHRDHQLCSCLSRNEQV